MNAAQDFHPTAIIDEKAEIGNGVSIGPYSIIGPEVSVGEGTVIENHVTIKGDVKIGRENYIGAYTSIGLSAQDRAHRNEPTKVEIGDKNEIREYVSIHRGTLGGTGITKIGNDNQLFVSVHLGHDTSIGNRCMLANLTTLGGHVQIGSHVVTGGFSAFHQFCRIGDYAMLGGYSVAYQDVPPYMMCTGYRAKVIGLNRVGLERNGFDEEQISQIQKIFQIYFGSGMIPRQAVEKLNQEIEDRTILEPFLDFIADSKRGIVTKN